MRYFFDALVWTAGRVIGLFAVCGLLGGIFADIPGVSEDPSAQIAVNFLARCFNWALTTFREYPLGVVIYFFSLVLLRTFYIYPHVEALKREIRTKNPKKSLPSNKKRAKSKNGRKKYDTT